MHVCAGSVPGELSMDIDVSETGRVFSETPREVRQAWLKRGREGGEVVWSAFGGTKTGVSEDRRRG